MRTIQRKTEWPKWARYYAVDRNNGAWLYDKKPSVNSDSPWWCPNGATNHSGYRVRGPVKDDLLTWNESLRKIVPARKPKKETSDDSK